MTELRTVSGDVFLVDDADVELVNQYRWHSLRQKRRTYVVTNRRDDEGTWITVLLHRLLLNASKGVDVDHRNHDGLDNRRENLRLATRQQNMHNRRVGRSSSSGFKGVSWYSRDSCWRAQIRVGNRPQHLGYFSVEETAARAYDAAAVRHFGEFACLNFPV